MEKREASILYEIVPDNWIVIDAGDLDLLDPFSWRKHTTDFATTEDTQLVFLRKLLMCAPKDKRTVHINRDMTDYRRINLRNVPKGVYPPEWIVESAARDWVKTPAGNYMVQVTIAGRKHGLGTYGTTVEAEDVARRFRESWRPYCKFPPVVDKNKLPKVQGLRSRLCAAKAAAMAVKQAQKAARLLDEQNLRLMQEEL